MPIPGPFRSVLVTGATGFIGSHLAEALLSAGARVRATVRDPSRLRWLAGLPVEPVRTDLASADPASLSPALDGLDAVFHVAGLVKALRPDEYWRANVTATENLLQACARCARPPRRILVVTSLAAAGPSADGHPLDEDEPPNPITPYGRSKLAEEEVVRHHRERLAITVVRPPVVYGPRDAEVFQVFRLARFGLTPLIGRGKRLSLVYVGDLVEGMMQAAASERAAGRTYFLAHPDTPGWDGIAAAFADSLGVHGVRLTVPDAWVMLAGRLARRIQRLLRARFILDEHKAVESTRRAWVCSPRRAKDDFGFHAATGLTEGFRRTAAWYYARQWLPTLGSRVARDRIRSLGVSEVLQRLQPTA